MSTIAGAMSYRSACKDGLLYEMVELKVICHPLYGMNKFVTNKSNLPQDGGTSVSFYGVIGYHVTLWEGHMIANPSI